MADYIDRDAFIKHYRELLCKDCDKRKGMKNGKLKFVYKVGEAPCRACWVEDMIGCVDDAPAADVRPVVHGRWLTKEYMYGDPFSGIPDKWIEKVAEYGDCAYCSECAGYAKFDATEEYALTPFCPNCGADMRGETNG